MGEEANAKLGAYSVLGAFVGSAIWSWAAQIFGNSATSGLLRTLIVFFAGLVLGAVFGMGFHTTVRSVFGRDAIRKAEWTGRTIVAVVGALLVTASGIIFETATIDSPYPSIGESIMMACIGVLGLLVIALGIYPPLTAE